MSLPGTLTIDLGGWGPAQAATRRISKNAVTLDVLEIVSSPWGGAASADARLGRSLHHPFLIALGCVSSGKHPGCFLDFDGLHQYAFPPIG